ncbi:uncharacterized protein EI97DRAFT_96390 [Westerdykella ornata]|uniref:MARVEL domain-containing protein n=1 Tax=Westerdykella ornata TaxID=318751 RepID=A0A6A6JF98_WESOR|nr:uncharacterized protein EI97DRAFT_96390 [Westerdykella ornata]KAF2274668.1 hypothetical protein EI97DRAFT_96390 [Westerdykella ornata]
MKVNPAPLRTGQAALMGLCAALSVATLGTSAHTLDIFNKQQTSNPWWLPLWPQHFNVHGTKALVATSTVTFVLSAVFLVLALVPRFNLTPTVRALLGLGTILPSSLLALVTIVYAHILNSDSPEQDTIQTWTCKYKNSQPMEEEFRLPSEMGNGAFKSICMESKFALYGTLVVFLLLGMSMLLTIVTWLADKWAARQSRKEVEMTAH